MWKIVIFIGNSIVIATLGAVAAWLTLAAVVAAGVWFGPASPYEPPGVLPAMFGYALAACFVLGLPIALLVYALARQQLIRTPAAVFMIGALAGIMMLLASFVLGDGAVALTLGLPSFAAAMTFAGLGYLWILKPQNRALNV